MGETVIDDKKELLVFDQQGFNIALRSFSIYDIAFEDLIAELEKFGKVKKADYPKIKNVPKEFCHKFILDQFPEIKALGISYEKLKELREDLKLDALDSAIQRIEQIPSKDRIKPSLEDFNIYADTDAQIEAKRLVEAICECLNRLNEIDTNNGSGFLYYDNLQAQFTKAIQLKEKKAVPIYTYIKNIDKKMR